MYLRPAKITYITDNVAVSENISSLLLRVRSHEVNADYRINFTPGQDLLSIMKDYGSLQQTLTFTTETADFGEFITTIDGVTADKSKEFWNFKINGKDAPVGVSAYKPNNTDNISFILTAF